MHLRVEFALLCDPLLQGTNKWCHHVKLAGIGCIVVSILFESGQIRELIPLNLADLLPRPGRKLRIHGYTSKDVKPHMLFAHRDLDVLDVLFVLDQASFSEIQARFLMHLSDRAVQVLLILVDFTARKTPTRTLLPPFYQDHMVHGIVEQDRASHGDPSLVGQELGKGGDVMVVRPLRHEWAMLKDAHRKRLEGQRREGRIERPNKVLVEPLRLFNLEADALNRLEFLPRQVYDKPHTQVIQPYLVVEAASVSATVIPPFSLPINKGPTHNLLVEALSLS